MAAYESIHRGDGSKRIAGYLLPVFIKNGPHHLTNLKVYQDGMVDCWELVSFDRFKQRVEDGWVVTSLPEGAEIFAFPLGSFVATQVKSFVREAELVKEVADAIDKLNGRPTSARRCHEAYEGYTAAPSDEARERLRAAYEAMPAHNRRYVLGDMDRKDSPIREIIYPHEAHDRRTPAAAEPAAALPTSAETRRAKVPGALAMALRMLYQGSGLEPQPLFPKSSLADVEELFRNGRVDDGIGRVMKDISDALTMHPSRPAVAIRVSNALSQLADYLFHLGRVPESVEAHLRSIRLNPDGMSGMALARIAVVRNDSALAKALVDSLAEFGINGIANEQIATVLGLDVEAFKRLL